MKAVVPASLAALVSAGLFGVPNAWGANPVDVEFEDVAVGTTFPSGSFPTSFVTEGVTISLPAGTSSVANARIRTDPRGTLGTDNVLGLFANARAVVELPAPATGGFFSYGDSGGDNFLIVNGVVIDFDVFAPVASGFHDVGGVTVWGDTTSLKLDGPIQTIAFLGQELLVDSINLTLVPEPASAATLGVLALIASLPRRSRRIP